MADEQIDAVWREATLESIHDSKVRFARAIEAAAVAPLLAQIDQKQARIDRLIQEVAVGADIEAAQRARIAELESQLAALQKKIEPNCPKCGDNRQVWSNQITGKKTCHRAYCQTEID